MLVYARPFPHSPALRALLEYDVYFAPNFPFNLGGKLPGLYGAASGNLPSEACVGGYDATGTNCWSMRLMWRAYGAGEVNYTIVNLHIRHMHIFLHPTRLIYVILKNIQIMFVLISLTRGCHWDVNYSHFNPELGIEWLFIYK